MGEVYLAHDAEHDRDVALKVPKISEGDDAQLLARFNREVEHAAKVSHRNICPILDKGQVGPYPYVAMGYIEGRPLTEFVNRVSPMDPRRAAEIVEKVALAMAEAHDKGIIHRDLKPANIMIDKAGEPVIMDFGLARADSDDALTQPGDHLGTIPYMPPEAFKGDRLATGPHGDVYSLGVILYELITGSRPYEGAIHLIIRAILDEKRQVQPPSQLRQGLTPKLDAPCLKALARQVKDRHSGMRAFAAELGAYLDGIDPKRTKPAGAGGADPKAKPRPEVATSQPGGTPTEPGSGNVVAWVILGVAAAAIAALVWYVLIRPAA